jgi:hypothetical protein
MTTFSHGDRVRYATIGDDGFPLVRYGFVGGVTHDDGPVVVMLDGELGGDVVNLAELEPVHISNVILKLGCADLLDDPELRGGLISLWQAEAEDAGLQITALHPIGGTFGLDDGESGRALAQLTAAGEDYVLRAVACPTEHNTILLQATR